MLEVMAAARELVENAYRDRDFYVVSPESMEALRQALEAAGVTLSEPKDSIFEGE